MLQGKLHFLSALIIKLVSFCWYPPWMSFCGCHAIKVNILNSLCWCHSENFTLLMSLCWCHLIDFTLLMSIFCYHSITKKICEQAAIAILIGRDDWYILRYDKNNLDLPLWTTNLKPQNLSHPECWKCQQQDSMVKRSYKFK